MTLGHRYSNSGSGIITRRESNPNKLPDQLVEQTLSADGKAVSHRQGPFVVINISHDNWVFECMPGAIRRILMNLTGNSLKYTQRGFVKVDLILHETRSRNRKNEERSSPRFNVTLTVTDTGKGISQEYLKTKLFTPFSQESKLATGSGLGLSMVNDLVKLLGGSIEIQSQVGEGTRVEVNLPLKRAKSGARSSYINRSLSEVKTRELEAVPDSLRDQFHDRTFHLRIDQAKSHAHVKESLRLYLSQWFSMREIPEDSADTCDFAFVDQIDDHSQPPPSVRHIVLLRMSPLGGSLNSKTKPVTENYGLLTLPFGPN